MSPTERIRKRVEQHFKPSTVNFWCHVIEGTFAVVGLQFASDLEVLPLLVKELGGSNTIVGVIQALITASVAGPLILAPRMEAAIKRKGIVLGLGVFMRVPMLLVGLALISFGLKLPGLCLVLVAGSLLVRKFAGAVLNPMWMDLLAETIPPKQQSRLMGSRTVGDLVQLSIYTYQRTNTVDFRIAGCFDLFPTWYPDEGALFVGNLDYLHRTLGQTYPYEVWMTLAPGLDYVDISETTIGGVNIYKKGWGWDAPRLDMHSEQEQPRRQGLLGLLSVGFLAAAGLSVIGFILYLQFSFRQRLVEFGVLRAVGLGVPQMGRILTWEIVLLLMISIGLGTGLGAGIARAFVPYLQIDIPEQSTVPPYVVAVDWSATVGIYVLFGTLGLVAVAILIVLLRRMRLFEALKLGETL